MVVSLYLIVVLSHLLRRKGRGRETKWERKSKRRKKVLRCKELILEEGKARKRERRREKESMCVVNIFYDHF